MTGHNQNDGRYRRRFVNWRDRPSNAASEQFVSDTAETVRKLNSWLDEHEARGVLAEAEALCASEARRQAARTAAQAEGWTAGEPGE